MKIDKTTVQLVLAIADEGSISRAADRLSLAVAAASKRLTDLELGQSMRTAGCPVRGACFGFRNRCDPRFFRCSPMSSRNSRGGFALNSYLRSVNIKKCLSVEPETVYSDTYGQFEAIFAYTYQGCQRRRAVRWHMLYDVNEVFETTLQRWQRPLGILQRLAAKE